MTPDKDRKAQERQRYRDAGLVAVTVWVLPKHRKMLREYASRFKDDLAALEAKNIPNQQEYSQRKRGKKASV